MDEVYLQKVLDGDMNAFRYFIKTYKDFMFSMSFSILKNEYLAEEVVQESFIKAFQKLSTFKRQSLFKTWIGRIVINESLRRSQSVSSHELLTIDDLPKSEMSTLESTLDKLLLSDQKKYISLVFEQLSTPYALVLELFYLQENSISEIKTMTGWTESKIKMSLLRGKKEFCIRLEKLLKSEFKEIL